MQNALRIIRNSSRMNLLAGDDLNTRIFGRFCAAAFTVYLLPSNVQHETTGKEAHARKK
jgi:hypothetical protein